MNKSGFVIVNEGLHKVGLNDKDGNVVLECVYDKILDYDDDGYVRFLKDGIYGTVDLNGEIAIPHSVGLTHLGVFYGGTARAKKKDKWGLVDVHGNEVGNFCYKQINAHYNDGYKAFLMDNTMGFLAEDGTFSPSEKRTKTKSHNNISEVVHPHSYKPQTILTKHYHLFDEAMLYKALKEWTGEGYSKLKWYYRDTDAPIDLNFYKVGTVVRAGEFLETTDRLRRPVHKTRFFIATKEMPSVEEYRKHLNFQQRENGNNDSKACDGIPFKIYVIHPNACFMVIDVQKYGGVTQIVMLQVPLAAVELAKKNKIKLTLKPVIWNGKSLKETAQKDLAEKYGNQVHGYSLSDDWSERMYRPLGLDASLQPYQLDLTYNYQCMAKDKAEKMFYQYCDTFFTDNKNDWQQQNFMKKQDNTVMLVVGDITRLEVDAIVSETNASQCDGCKTGQSKMTDADRQSYKKIIHTVVPEWCGGNAEEARFLASCYDTTIQLAIKNDLKSIAFPCMGIGKCHFPKEETAKVALDIVVKHLKTGKCKCDILFCCSSNEDAEIYKEQMEKQEYSQFLY